LIAIFSTILLAAAARGAEREERGARIGALNRGDYFITVLAGPMGGIYFPVGSAFAEVLARAGYKTSVQPTSATGENINAILTGQGELAIAMADCVIQAVEAFGAYKGRPPAYKLRALMGLWPNYCQIITAENSGIKKFSDLRGKRVIVGEPDSGVEMNARMMFDAHGMSYDDCGVEFMSYVEALDQLKNGLCDAAFVTSGLNNPMIMDLARTMRIKFIPVEGEPLRRLIAKYPFYMEGRIPAGAYDAREDVTTAAVMNIMLVRDSLPKDVVYDMLENIYSRGGTSAIRDAYPPLHLNIGLDGALRGIKGTPIPLHDGAIEFYKDKKIL
jgi:TRAP transporter TAXI family solute receptor